MSEKIITTDAADDTGGQEESPDVGRSPETSRLPDGLQTIVDQDNAAHDRTASFVVFAREFLEEHNKGTYSSRGEVEDILGNALHAFMAKLKGDGESTDLDVSRLNLDWLEGTLRNTLIALAVKVEDGYISDEDGSKQRIDSAQLSDALAGVVEALRKEQDEYHDRLAAAVEDGDR